MQRGTLHPGRAAGRRILACAVTLALATIMPAGQAAAEEDECADPQAQQQMNYCNAQEFWKLDGELTKLYDVALADRKKQDQDAPTPEGPDLKTEAEALTIAEKAWLQYRDAHCDGMGYKARGGSLEPLLVGNCKIELTRNRMKELEDLMKRLAD